MNRNGTGIVEKRSWLHFGSERIRVSIRFSEHEKLKICVYPDLTVVLNAPSERTPEEVLERARRRAPWILRQLRYFEQFLPRTPARRYVSGETILYLGRQYRLKVAEGDSRPAKLVGRFLHVRVPDRTDGGQVKGLVADWYRQHAQTTFSRRLDQCQEAARRYGVERPELRLRAMKRRWGSCSGTGRILLNTELVKAPVHCIDYVIMHELCHLRFANHGPEFYRLLDRLMPDWRQRKERLERVGL